MSYPIGIQETDYTIQQPAQSSFDLKKILHKVVGILPWAILGLIVAMVCANLYLRYTPSKHKVAAYILIKKEEEANLDYKLLKGLDVVEANSDIQNQMDIFRSYTLMERVVDTLKLNFHVRQEGRVSGSQLYGYERPFFLKMLDQDDFIKPCIYKMLLNREGFTIDGSDGNRSFKYGDTVTAQCGRFVLERNPMVKINPKGYTLQVSDKYTEANNWRGSLSAELTNDKGGGIIEISLTDEIPERAVEVLNTLIAVFNDADLNDKNIVTKKTIHFLDGRVDTVSQELGVIEGVIEKYKRNNQITNLEVQGSIFLDKSLQSNKEKIDQYGQYKVLEALETFISNSKDPSDIIPSSMGIGEQILTKLILSHNDLVFIKQQTEEKSTPYDPKLKQAINDVNSSKENLLRNIKLLKKAYQSTVNDLEGNVTSLQNKIASLPEKERELLRLKRLATVKETLYVYLLQKREEAQLSLASKINNTRVIDYAIDQGSKNPNKTQVKLLAILLGLIVPIAIILLKDFFNNKITNRQQIEAVTTVPVIGELSYVKGKKILLIDSKSRSAVAEQFRILRTNLSYANNNKKPKCIMVSSFISGEGKSFVSINLASTLSLTGAKVIILEFDLRKPKLSKQLGISSQVGLSNYVSNDLALFDIIQEIPGAEYINFISSGPIPPNPAEMLMSDKTAALVETLKEQYDYIIVDTAPIGLVTDALLLEKFADMTLFIIRHQFTLKHILPYIDKLQKDAKFKNMSIVVNGIKKDGTYGYSFGLGNSYGYYISGKKKSIFNNIFGFFQGQGA
ncbi:MAG: polysaccharide biosynthesis tyrosine autokinase [Pedobacter sp.]|nr:polysaccharide biosynthesis tyrosine autokinase [Chitinophagaceae bacterium]